jgi:hypothetical protein
MSIYIVYASKANQKRGRLVVGVTQGRRGTGWTMCQHRELAPPPIATPGRAQMPSGHPWLTVVAHGCLRSTRVSKMAMVNHESCLSSMARPALTPAARSRSSCNSDERVEAPRRVCGQPVLSTFKVYFLHGQEKLASTQNLVKL